jgi:hypothetical protein
MRHYALTLFFLLLIAAAVTLACGSSPHILQSVTISPATADAQNGEAQFTATGFFTGSPSEVTPLSATWGACSQLWQPTTGVTVSSNGLARCATGASGTYAIFAFDGNPSSTTCTVGIACGPPPCGSVANTAQLTCP